MKNPENYSEMIVINFIQSLLIENKEPIYLTTQDIQDKVADMAEIELNQIAEIMFSCGFKVINNKDKGHLPFVFFRFTY